MTINSLRKLAFSLLLLGSMIQAHAGEAVSDLNGKLGFTYGDFDSDDGGTFSGSFALPLTSHFGAQFDGLYAHIAGNDFYGAGGHLFWRDWDRGLIGLAFGGVDADDVRSGEIGIEAEYYFRAVTLGVYTGVATIKYGDPVPFIDTDETTPFGSVYLGIYPIPNLLLRPSYTRKFNNNQYALDMEYALPVRNLTLTAEGMLADHDFHQVQVGLRYYFGGDKSLKDRHRRDDPVDVVSGSLTSIGTYGAEYVEKANAYILALQQAGPVSAGSTLGGSLVLSTGGSGSYGGSNTYSVIDLTTAGAGTITLSPGSGYVLADGGQLTDGTFNLAGGGTLVFNNGVLIITP